MNWFWNPSRIGKKEQQKPLHCITTYTDTAVKDVFINNTGKNGCKLRPGYLTLFVECEQGFVCTSFDTDTHTHQQLLPEGCQWNPIISTLHCLPRQCMILQSVGKTFSEGIFDIKTCGKHVVGDLWLVSIPTTDYFYHVHQTIKARIKSMLFISNSLFHHR